MKRILFLLIFCSIYSLSCFSQQKEPMHDKHLIVLDIQEYYTNNKLSVVSSQKLIDSVNYIISKTISNNVTYIKSVHKLLNLSLSYPFIYVTYDSSAMRLDNRLNLVNNHILTKEKTNTFSVKELNNFLEQKNVNEIIIIGLLAEQCVYKSLIAGRKLGYNMYVVPEAIIGKSEKSKEKVIKKLTKKGIKIININTI
jgi:nicotinamidase-related amidase